MREAGWTEDMINGLIEKVQEMPGGVSTRWFAYHVVKEFNERTADYLARVAADITLRAESEADGQ
jgi:hypothetical protein